MKSNMLAWNSARLNVLLCTLYEYSERSLERLRSENKKVEGRESNWKFLNDKLLLFLYRFAFVIFFPSSLIYWEACHNS